jgi:DNA-binding CsgD family transcriptional regulator
VLIKPLSPREEEIVALSVEGLTNEAIAHRLGIGIGTVNTYWVRIKLKVGGSGRTDTVVRIIQEKADLALREANTERKGLTELLAGKQNDVIQLNATIAMLHLAMDQIKSTVWAVDKDLRIELIANGEYPSVHFGVRWDVGKSVYEIFKTEDPGHPAIAAHLSAVSGTETDVRLQGEFANMFLRTIPLKDEGGESMGCISILNTVG